MSGWFEPPYLAAWTLIVAIACNVSCAILGCFLVLRRTSLLGDGISHGVLPGLFVGYLLGGDSNPAVLFVAAVVFGLLTALLTQTLTTYGSVAEDASLGIVFTSLFALGVVLVSRFAARIHIDADCILYGVLEIAAVDTRPVLGVEVPRALFSLGPTLLAVLLFVGLLWKELKLSSFDAPLATAMGFPGPLLHYLLVAMVAWVAVGAFEAVGSILVIAMLIVPAAAAQLLTDRLHSMLCVAVLVAVLSAVLGVAGGRWWDVNVAGAMSVAAGLLFTLAVVLAPRHGVLAKAISNVRLSLRIAEEDVVATLFRLEERAAGGRIALSREECSRIAGEGVVGRLALRRCRSHALVAIDGHGAVSLTDVGREAGRSIVRSHRLWESYLDQHFELPADHLHEPAERIEHFIGPELRERMAAELDAPDHDPHGREIPRHGERPGSS